MRMKILGATVFSLLLSLPSLSQTSSTVHVFPQLVDGKTTGGFSYFSLLTVTNLSSSSSTCTLSPVGVPANRFGLALTQTLATNATLVNITKGADALASGWATLSCSQPVQASLMYAFLTPNGTIVSMATVFPAPPATYANFPIVSGVGFRYAIAIANTGTTPISVTAYLTNSGGQTTNQTFQVPAASQYVHFIDELMTVPSAGGLNTFELTSPTRFNVTALLFSGSVFSTLVPATLP